MRAHGAGARAGRVPRRDDRAAAARRAGQGAEADDRAGPGADPDLPRGDRAEEHRAGGRDRRRLDPDAPLARAPARAAQVARGGRRPRRALARRLRHRADGAGHTSATTSQGARDAMRPFVALYVGGMGSRKQNFYNQLMRPLRVRGRRAGGPGPLPRGPQGRGDGGAAGRAASTRSRSSARRTSCASGCASTATPASARSASRRWRSRRRSASTQLRLVAECRRGRLRVLLGAFGDPGHAFPMLGPGRAPCAPAATTCSLQTWERWREPDAEREGLRFAPAPEYHVFPTPRRPLKPYEAVARAVTVTRPLVAALRPGRRRQRHPDARPGARRRARGRARRDAHPPRRPAHRAGLSAVLARRAAAAHADRRAGCGARSIRSSAADWPLGRDELNDTRAPARAAAAATASTAASRRDLALVGHVPPARVPAPRAPPATHVVGPLLWEPPPATSSCRRATRRSCSSRRRRRRTPSTGCCAPPLAGLADLPVRVLATWNRRAPAPPLPVVPANARLVEWVQLRADDAALRPRRLPRRPRDGRPRAGERLRRGRRARARAT